MTIRLVLAALLLPVTTLAQTYLPTDGYRREEVAGFAVFVNPVVGQHGKPASDALALVRRRLVEAAKTLPPEAVERLRAVRLFVEWKSPTSDCLAYHPTAADLGGDHANPDKVKALEIGSLDCFARETASAEPMLLVRGLALAYLDQVVGGESAEVAALWRKARNDGMYRLVPYGPGGMRESVALVSPPMFFAETTEALFGLNDYFPFNVDDLARFDRPACDAVEKAWGARGLCNGDAKKAAQKKPAKKAPARKTARAKKSKTPR